MQQWLEHLMLPTFTGSGETLPVFSCQKFGKVIVAFYPYVLI
jgi:hypothetical protein